jgi:broad specificity phosphatase PhoE
MTTRVLVLRHGQTHGTVDGLFCGHTETELTPLGVAQARAAGRRLQHMEIDAAYSSDLSRAADTARHALEPKPDVAITHDRRIREMYYGDWEGRPGRDIGKETPDLLRDFFQAKVHAAPGGETIQQLRERTTGLVHEAVKAHDGGTILLVSHGNAIVAMLAEFLRLPIEATWSMTCNNTSITRMDFSKSGRFTLVGFNDYAHTEGLAEAGA